MQLRTGLQVVAAGEMLERLRLAVFEDLEVLTGQVGQDTDRGDRSTVAVTLTSSVPARKVACWADG